MNTPSQLPAPAPDFQLMGPSDDYPPAPAPRLPLRKVLFALRRFWWVPLLTLILFAGAAAAYLVWIPPTFVSTSSMWETEKLRLPEGALFAEDPQNYLGTQSELIRSGRIQQLALARLEALLTNGVPRDENGEPLEVDLKVRQAPKSAVFIVEASASNPTYVQAYLDSLMNEYLAYKRNVRKVVSGDTLASISEQVLRLERDLKADQDALTAFQRTNNLAILQEEGTIAGGYLARLKTQLSDYTLEAKLLEATALEMEAGAGAGTNASIGLLQTIRGQNSSSSVALAERQSAFQQLELLRMEREKLSKYLRPKHPKIVKLDADIARAEALLNLYRTQTHEQLAATQQALRLRISSVQDSIKEWEAKVVESNARIAEAERLKLNVTRTQSLYDRLVTLLQNVDISRNIDQSTLAILEPASPAVRTYKQELATAMLAIFAGLGIGLGIVGLVAFRDDQFTSLVEVTEKIGGPIVGQVPEVTGGNNGVSLPLLTIDDDRHMYVESFRNLRSALLFLPTAEGRPRVLLITSAVPNEGKSTVAANLGRALALGGSRVVLIDADLRKGRLHEMMGLQCEPGLADALRNPDALETALQSDSIPNFMVLPRGRAASHSADQFLGQTFHDLLAKLRERFDYVLIDSCPVFAADDATTLAPKVDGTLFVVRSRFSREKPVREALELLYQRQARVLGLVFNRADASSRSYYYYKYGEYEQNAETLKR